VINIKKEESVPCGTIIAQKRYSSKKIVVYVPCGTNRGLIFTKKEAKITGMFHVEQLTAKKKHDLVKIDKDVPRGTIIAQKRYSSKKMVVDVPRGT